ncbi:hypothetical protein [Fimbriiglobus ruber]|uniref:Uncharacterized protein n=1 Tax=Fimbriiglobus ruber TaxID=1908690 RepID=A0A225E2T4_9BACT|nr:hypothetical protein [Fimbriiglobus ruber]OWK42985.1 hypothetical protein FRUB_02584 [Fimbriiglobus ruber]
MPAALPSLSALELLTADGDRAALGSYLTADFLVVVFLRHLA